MLQFSSLEALSDETEAQADEHQAKLPAAKAKVTAPQMMQAMAKATAAYPYSQLPLVVHILTGYAESPHKSPHQYATDHWYQMFVDLELINGELDPDDRWDEGDLVVLAEVCSVIGLPHSKHAEKNSRLKVKLWNKEVLRACSKLRAMCRLTIVN